MEIQNIITILIVAVVLLKVAYSIYKSLTTKDSGLCGGCSSCSFKKELKKKGKLKPLSKEQINHYRSLSANNLRYSKK